jgi:hypothetical protein
MSIHEEHIKHAVKQVEALAKLSRLIVSQGQVKPSPEAQFRASFMAEVARRVEVRAAKIEEDWNHLQDEY